MEEREHLRHLGRGILENKEQEWGADLWPVAAPGEVVAYGCTDASMDKWSWVRMCDGRVIDEGSDRFDTTDNLWAAAPIYYNL